MIEEIAAQIEGSESIFAIDYRGISVPEAARLRGNLREAEASFRIVKNRLTKLAAEKAGREELTELLEGPTALAFVRGDTAMAAKAISNFNREHDVLTFKGGFMEGLSLDQETFSSIARLPSRDVLNGQFAGVVASPLTGLVRGLGSMVSGLAVALQQIADQGLVSGEAPAEAEAARDPDTPGREAEEVSGSDSPGSEAEDVSGSASEQPDAKESDAEAEAAEPRPASDPDTPGSAAEDVSGPEVAEQESGDPDAPGREAEEASGSASEEPETSDETEE